MKSSVVILLLVSASIAGESANLTGPILMSVLQSTAIGFDIYSTNLGIKSGHAEEGNPIAIKFIGKKPSVPSMILFTSTEVIGTFCVSYLIKKYNIKFVSKMWFTPSIYFSIGHFIAYNNNMKKIEYIREYYDHTGY